MDHAHFFVVLGLFCYGAYKLNMNEAGLGGEVNFKNMLYQAFFDIVFNL